MERNARKVYRGKVVSDKMDKTITVAVERRKHIRSTENVLNIQKNTKHMMKTIQLAKVM